MLNGVLKIGEKCMKSADIKANKKTRKTRSGGCVLQNFLKSNSKT